MGYSRVKRTDHNQAEIAQALRALGASVAILAGVGGGVPDLLVGWRGQNYLLEVKNLDGRGKRLTLAEREFHETWRGQASIVESVDQAIELLSEA
jgi:hypothetical protein